MKDKHEKTFCRFMYEDALKNLNYWLQRAIDLDISKGVTIRKEPSGEGVLVSIIELEEE